MAVCKLGICHKKVFLKFYLVLLYHIVSQLIPLVCLLPHLECPAVADEGDDEDEGTHGDQEVGSLVDMVRVRGKWTSGQGDKWTRGHVDK